jgi:hypothetical protein
MNDVFTTLAVIGILLIWAFFAYVLSIMHMDIGLTRSWWIGQTVLLLGAAFWIYQAIRWSVTT